MGRIISRNQPCEKCGSSDAKQIYEDKSAFCFSCRQNFLAPKEGTIMPDNTDWNKYNFNKVSIQESFDLIKYNLILSFLY